MSSPGWRRAVVRNGDLLAREVLTTVGRFAVQMAKGRGRSGAGVRFKSARVPRAVRGPLRLKAPGSLRRCRGSICKGISSGDLAEAREVLVGEDAKGLSAFALGWLKTAWAAAYQGWTGRRLDGQQPAAWWGDGIHTPRRERDDPKLCLLVIVGVRAQPPEVRV